MLNRITNFFKIKLPPTLSATADNIKPLHDSTTITFLNAATLAYVSSCATVSILIFLSKKIN